MTHAEILVVLNEIIELLANEVESTEPTDTALETTETGVEIVDQTNYTTERDNTSAEIMEKITAIELRLVKLEEMIQIADNIVTTSNKPSSYNDLITKVANSL